MYSWIIKIDYFQLLLLAFYDEMNVLGFWDIRRHHHELWEVVMDIFLYIFGNA